jgi:hypothetical protein
MEKNTNENSLVELNKDSINAKLYRWFYNIKDYQMPVSLCPYFWNSVIMWIFILPFGIVTIPATIAKMQNESFGERIAIGFFGYVMLFFAITLLITPVTYIMYGIIGDNSLIGSMQHSGIVVWAGLIIIGICLGVFALFKRIKEAKEKKHVKYIWTELGDYELNPNYVGERKDNIIIAFIKAKYNKYCPTIKWK